MSPQERRASLLIYFRDAPPQVIPLQAGKPIVLGRDSPADVRIQDRTLSREHARFQLFDGEVRVEDLGSMNGVKVAGQPIKSGVVCPLPPGVEILMGSLRAFVHLTSPADGDLLGLISHERFRIALEDEVVRSRYYGRPLSVLFIRAASEHEASHVNQWGQRLSSLLRPVDRAGFYSQHALEILLSETDADTAMKQARSIVAGRAESDPQLYIGVASFPGAATNAESLIGLSSSAAQQATKGQPVQLAKGGAWLPGAELLRVSSNTKPIVQSGALKKTFEAVRRVAGSSATVVIVGETGVGKEIVAQAIHDASPRRSKPMVTVNCGGIPPDLVQATLFGHKRGAFTGAFTDEVGVFGAADGGTVFLDEIGELPLVAQATLLRVLESKHIMRVGVPKEFPVDVRVLAATNKDLELMITKETFRSDLYFRLNTLTIQVPPLRNRIEDIEPLAMLFLREANESNGRRVHRFTPGALALMKSYTWPGNVRELKNAVERAVLLAESDEVTEDELPERLKREERWRESSEVDEQADPEANRGSSKKAAARGAAASAGSAVASKEGLKASLKRYEREAILAALQEAGGNQTKAAEILKVPLRTLADKIKKLKITRGGYGAK